LLISDPTWNATSKTAGLSKYFYAKYDPVLGEKALKQQKLKYLIVRIA